MVGQGPAAATDWERRHYQQLKTEAMSKEINGILKEYPEYEGMSASEVRKTLDGKRRAKEVAKNAFNTEENKQKFFKQVKLCAYLEVLTDLKAKSNTWLTAAYENQEEAQHHEYIRQMATETGQLPAAIAPNALHRGPHSSFGKGGFSRGHQMVQHATHPNPSTLPHRSGGGLAGTMKKVADRAVDNARGAVDALSDFLGLGGPPAHTCMSCNKEPGFPSKHDPTFFICGKCMAQQKAAEQAQRPASVAGAAAMARQQQQQQAAKAKPKTVPATSFGPGYEKALHRARDRLPPAPPATTHAKTAPKLKSKEKYPPLNVRSVQPTGPVGGGAAVLQPAPLPAEGRGAAAAPPRRSKQGQAKMAAQKAQDNHGTEDNPIEIGDSDDEGPGAAAAAAAAGAAGAAAAAAEPWGPSPGIDDEERDRVLRAVEHGDKKQERQARRAAAGAAAAAAAGFMTDLATRLRGLRCQMPPSGGFGSVEFTAADLPRLDRDEFLNDTAIDFYLRWVRCELERTHPDLAKRCYFFNSFFYKKLTEKVTDPKSGRAVSGPGRKAEHNYPKVAKWTRGVDLFSKDYIFVPIHDHLHWSLAIVCHPAAEPGKKDVAPRKRPSSAGSSGRGVVDLTDSGSVPDGGASEQEVDPRLRPTPDAFIIHLDSLSGGHASPLAVLRSYLQEEWKKRAQDPNTPADWVPKRAATEGAAERSFGALQYVSPRIPVQDNHCDCGLFVCAYVEFFTAALPPALSLAAVERLKTAGDKDGVDLWEGHDAHYPGFLTKHWFLTGNGSALRWELARMVLEGIGQNAGLMDAHGNYLADCELPPEKHDALEALMSGLEAVRAAEKESGSSYIRPEEWRLQAVENKKGRAEQRARKAEQLVRQKAEREAKRASEGAAGLAPTRSIPARANRGQHSRWHGGMAYWSDDDIGEADLGGDGGAGGGGGGGAAVAQFTRRRNQNQPLDSSFAVNRDSPAAPEGIYSFEEIYDLGPGQDGAAAAAAAAEAEAEAAPEGLGAPAPRVAALEGYGVDAHGFPAAADGPDGAGGGGAGSGDGDGLSDSMDFDVEIDDAETMDIDTGPVSAGTAGTTGATGAAPAAPTVFRTFAPPPAAGGEDSDIEIVENGNKAALPQMDTNFEPSVTPGEPQKGADARRSRRRTAAQPAAPAAEVYGESMLEEGVPDDIEAITRVELRHDGPFGDPYTAVTFQMEFSNQPEKKLRVVGADAWDRVYSKWFRTWEYRLPHSCKKYVEGVDAPPDLAAAAVARAANHEAVTPSAEPSIDPTELQDGGEEEEERDGGVVSAPLAAAPAAAAAAPVEGPDAAAADVIDLVDDEGPPASPATKKRTRGAHGGAGNAAGAGKPAPTPKKPRSAKKEPKYIDESDDEDGETPSPPCRPSPAARKKTRKQANPQQGPSVAVPRGPRTQKGLKQQDITKMLQSSLNNAGKGKKK